MLQLWYAMICKLKVSTRSSPLEVLIEKDVLKICSRFIGKHSCRSAISIKLQSNFIEIALWHGCSSVNLLHIFRTPFPKKTFRRLCRKYPWIFLLAKFRDHSSCSHGVIAFSQIHVIWRWWPYQSPTNLSGHNPFQPSVAFQTENGANQMTMKEVLISFFISTIRVKC